MNKLNMIMKTIQILSFIFLFCGTNGIAQTFERYKKHLDTSILSNKMGFEKKISVTVPLEWQEDSEKKFPLIIIFDKQNQRSHNYMLQTIDYLTSNEQMPSSIIVSVESSQENRYNETSHKISNKKGLAEENEAFLFDELIPFAEQKYKASNFRVLIGHSRYGYFTTSLLNSHTDEINAIISLSPFFTQEKVNLIDSIQKIMELPFKHTVYYRFGIGNDYPKDFSNMDAMLKKNKNSLLNVKGSLFKDADHNVTPGLYIGTALYEIFEKWSASQAIYLANEQLDLKIINTLERDIENSYGTFLCFSLGLLNGKGWFLYSEENYEKAIEAWEILLKYYPNFSEAYLYIIDAQLKLGKDISQTQKLFIRSIDNSNFFTPDQKLELMNEFEKLKSTKK